MRAASNKARLATPHKTRTETKTDIHSQKGMLKSRYPTTLQTRSRDVRIGDSLTTLKTCQRLVSWCLLPTIHCATQTSLSCVSAHSEWCEANPSARRRMRKTFPVSVQIRRVSRRHADGSIAPDSATRSLSVLPTRVISTQNLCSLSFSKRHTDSREQRRTLFSAVLSPATHIVVARWPFTASLQWISSTSSSPPLT